MLVLYSDLVSCKYKRWCFSLTVFWDEVMGWRWCLYVISCSSARAAN